MSCEDLFAAAAPPSAYMWPKKYRHASCYRFVSVFMLLLALRHTIRRQGHGQASDQSSLSVIELIRAF